MNHIPLFKVFMTEAAAEEAKKVLLSGYIGQGKKVDELERALSPWVGSPNGVLVNSCTSAIRMALRLAGVGPDDEVVSTPQTCSATNTPILEQHAKIVWADIDPWSGCIDPLDVERKITPRTKAVIAVHWGGYPCDLDALSAICRKYRVALIEDAAHAFGAEYRGRKVGSFGSFACFSFQAIKHLTTVEGGMIVCPSVNDYRRARLLRWYGIDRDTPRKDLRTEEDIEEAGYKYNPNDIHAAIGLEQLKHISEILKKHRENAAFYDHHLDDLRRVKRLRYSDDRDSSYWIYTIRVDDRERFQEFMKDRGVMVSQVHVRNDLYTAFKAFKRNLPGVDEFSREQISIPVGWWLSEEDRNWIAEAVKEYDR